jgi:hypothetical protein
MPGLTQPPEVSVPKVHGRSHPFVPQLEFNPKRAEDVIPSPDRLPAARRLYPHHHVSRQPKVRLGRHFTQSCGICQVNDQHPSHFGRQVERSRPGRPVSRRPPVSPIDVKTEEFPFIEVVLKQAEGGTLMVAGDRPRDHEELSSPRRRKS